ncbi:DUF6415 family natural product biosynthesis protein (plasmid) [Streptomyces sp. NBC_01525]|uniref:DUF6415 family natural product biosynthesis protein n=1 Tax=Streptomyces sp. NBC_01525 TaxID=2903893 RepID=UPI002F90CD3C
MTSWKVPQGDLPVDVETISDTVRRALRFGATRPGLTTLADLEERLRGHIAVLLPDAEAAAARRGGSDGVEQTTRRLVSIRAQLGSGLGLGRLSAHVQVAALAQDCQWLLEHRGDHLRGGDLE